jgi:hypothetical protein
VVRGHPAKGVPSGLQMSQMRRAIFSPAGPVDLLHLPVVGSGR